MNGPRRDLFHNPYSIVNCRLDPFYFILDHLFSISLRPAGEFASLFFVNDSIFQIDLSKGNALPIDPKGESYKMKMDDSILVSMNLI